ncbi:MAG: glutathione peroxidase [Pelagibacterales bacterium MED-G40]|nr:MAG: glutathione peroxidase [Pelagibacterales bacterium MED-G40]
MFSFFSNLNANYDKLAYDFSFRGIDGNVINLENYKSKVIVVVNVASRCGYTPQYKDLQELWSKYKERNLVVIGIPTNNFKQEPGTNKDIKKFCESNFGISFPLTEKTNVIGADAHPFYKWAKKNYGIGAIPKWNFHKIVVDKNGKITDTFASFTKPSSKKFINSIEKEIKN